MLYGGVRTKAQAFFKKNPTATLQEYVQTTEGQLLRVINPETERECERLAQLSKQQGQQIEKRYVELAVEKCLEVDKDCIDCVRESSLGGAIQKEYLMTTCQNDARVMNVSEVDEHITDLLHLTNHQPMCKAQAKALDLRLKMEQFTNVKKCTRHGLQRLIERFTVDGLKTILA